MRELIHISQSLYKCIILLISLSFVQNSQATETGTNRCGETITITGSSNHSVTGENYQIQNATNNDLYREEIWGREFTASINLPKGDYTINIYMPESYQNAIGKRSCNVYIEDQVLIVKLDLIAEVGKDTEYLLSHNLSFKPTRVDASLNIHFTKNIDNAKFNAIEILNANNEMVACGMAHEFIAAIEPIEGNNPFIQHIFTADPSAHAFEDKVYVYLSHDHTNASSFNMRDYHVFSSGDMANWEDHRVALDVDSVTWATEYLWATDCAYKNGMYYFYLPVSKHLSNQ